MRVRFIFISLSVFFLFPAVGWSRLVPSNLDTNDRKFFSAYLAQTYSAQYMARPFYLGNNPGIEFGTTFQYRPLGAVKDRFISDDISSGIALSHIYVNKSLVYGLEMGLSSILSSFTSSVVSGFGGHLRWYPQILTNKTIQPVFQLYTEFTNFEDAYYNQDLGLHAAVGYNLKDFSFYAGGDFVFSSSSFSAVADGRPITSTGQREETDSTHFSPFVSVQFHFNNFHINWIQSYNFNASWVSRLNLSYAI